MNAPSPLRYPGGKSALSSLLTEIRKLNRLSDRAVAEPFGGGAGAALSLLYGEHTHELFINDADESIHDFWWSLLNRLSQFLTMLETAPVTIEEWRRQQAIYRSQRGVSRLQRGFATFYLNRCNRSGVIMNGGPIGGLEQAGNWKIDARFNKRTLKSRCQAVGAYRDRIRVSRLDGIKFISEADATRTFFFIDPPYFEKGPLLYLNALDEEYHQSLARQLKGMQDLAWVLTYDDCPQIRAMYEGWATIRPFSLAYAAAERRMGKEVLIAPRWLRLPDRQLSAAIDW